MFVYDFIQSTLSRFDQTLSKDEMIVIVSPSGIDVDGEVDPTGESAYLGLAYVLNYLLPMIPDKETEGGYTKEWNKKSVGEWIDRLFTLSGKANPFAIAGPTVSDASNRW